MNYTKAQLDSMNKAQLVDLAINLNNQVEASNGKPLSAAELEKRLLDLSEQAISVDKDAQKAKMEFDAKLEDAKLSYQKEIKELELKYDSGKGKSAEELLKIYEELKERAETAKSDLSYGLKQAEIEFKEKLDEIESKLDKARAESAEEVTKLEANLEKVKATTTEEVKSVKLAHDRTMEQLDYDFKIAIRDKKLDVANKIAKEYSSEIVNSKDLEELMNAKKAEAEEIEAQIASAVSAAESKVYAKENSKYNDLNSRTTSEIALLKNDKEHLTKTIASQEARIVDLEERLKNVPAQIAKAVEAAKSNVAVNQTSGK